MGARLDAMKRAAANPPEAVPLAVPMVTVPEKRKPKALDIQPPIIPPKLIKGKKAEPRKCCGTAKGQNVPHLPSCEATKKAKSPSITKVRKQALCYRPRLPDGSRYECFFVTEGSGGYWHGTLVIGGADCVFTGKTGSVMGLLKKLDDMYRQYLLNKSATEDV